MLISEPTRRRGQLRSGFSYFGVTVVTRDLWFTPQASVKPGLVLVDNGEHRRHVAPFVVCREVRLPVRQSGLDGIAADSQVGVESNIEPVLLAGARALK